VYPSGQLGTGLAVLGGDPRNTVGGGSEAAEFWGSADGTGMISAWTAIDPTNAKRRVRALIGNAPEARFDDRSWGPDDSLRCGKEQRVFEVCMRKI